MDIHLKYQVLKSDFDFISKENNRLRNQTINQLRQIENLKKHLIIAIEGFMSNRGLTHDDSIDVLIEALANKEG